jgi:hypothetical protein
MDQPRIPITPGDLETQVKKRLFLNAQPLSIDNRELDFPVALNKILNEANLKTGILTFTNCLFLNTVDVGPHNTVGEVCFENCLFKEDVNVASNGNVAFNNGNLVEGNLTYVILTEEISLSNVSIEKKLLIKGPSQKITLSRINTVVKCQEVTLFTPPGIVNVLDCNFDTIKILATSTEKVQINISSTSAKALEATIASINGRLRLTNSTIYRVDLNGASTAKIDCVISHCTKVASLDTNLVSFTNLQIRACEIAMLSFKGKAHQETNILIDSSILHHIRFQYVINITTISFQGITMPPDGSLSILDSNMGKTEFINCNFEHATLEFQNSRITDFFIAGSELPKKVVLHGKPNHIQAQLAFGQLTTSLQKQGDSVRALEYQSRELEAHYYSIPIFLKKWPFLNLTKVMLWLNKWSNQFGRNWGMGVVFSFSSGLLFFYFLILSSNEFHFAPHIYADSRLTSSYLKFMNPLRFFDTEALFKLNNDTSYLTLSGWSYLWDFLGRIFVAYGFYQTIQAFRRFGRK